MSAYDTILAALEAQLSAMDLTISDIQKDDERMTYRSLSEIIAALETMYAKAQRASGTVANHTLGCLVREDS